MRIMGLDYGSKTVGVAISDSLGITAQGIETIERKEDEAECLILKDTSAAEDTESLYEIVEDDVELSAILKVFEELLEDVDIEM